MNSLVVLFSLVALAAAKPSSLIGSELISYAAPAVAIPAAVSSQSRIDIKSSPSYVATAAIEPIARTVIAQPAVIAAPAIVSASAAVSHQSRIDIKSSPAVVSSYLSAPIATAAIAPTLIKSAAIATPAIAAPAIAAPAIATYAAPAILKSAIAPAVIAAPSVPLDTPEVLAARAAHFQAKALEGHFIHKRSVVAAPAYTTYAAAPLLSAPVVHAAPISYAAHLSYPTPILTKAYSLHPW